MLVSEKKETLYSLNPDILIEMIKTDKMIPMMQKLNPPKYGNGVRPIERLCAGQTLLCSSLGITVKEWDQQQFDPNRFYIEDIGSTPT